MEDTMAYTIDNSGRFRTFADAFLFVIKHMGQETRKYSQKSFLATCFFNGPDVGMIFLPEAIEKAKEMGIIIQESTPTNMVLTDKAKRLTSPVKSTGTNSVTLTLPNPMPAYPMPGGHC